MTRRLRPPPPPLELPEPGKPLAEMAGAERAAYLRQLRRALRDDQVRYPAAGHHAGDGDLARR
jgi:hypothetical protein